MIRGHAKKAVEAPLLGLEVDQSEASRYLDEVREEWIKPKALLETCDVARAAGVVGETVRGDVAAGRLRVFGITPRGTRLFQTEDMARYLEERRERFSRRRAHGPKVAFLGLEASDRRRQKSQDPCAGVEEPAVISEPVPPPKPPIS